MPPQLDEAVGVGYASQGKRKYQSISSEPRHLVEADCRKELPIVLLVDHLPTPNNPLSSMVDVKLKTIIILK